MTDLLTPPASRQNSESPEAQIKQSSEAESCTELIQSLDRLLERYLELLDRHQKLQVELAKKLSSDSGEVDDKHQLGGSEHMFAVEVATSNPPVHQSETNNDGQETESEIDNTDEDQSSSAPEPKMPNERPRFSNPIHWYGVLVPPSLRSAQASFTEAVDQCLPELASVVVQMQSVEREVERLRSELGQAYLNDAS
ncbi:uncharacterized protein ACLA_034450 [Aspergillus clavatus NRRL 1]|uniref:Vacuolar ATPase assembly protein VMA22 n=1 Tax=Aspergillus clavatus (strain ATCC 1007 / CBS 513.65 / DSM 816 / NCTC 3887 / NRRL 1 / QM 1276 / 107) TaxID=344612 RepID=A1CJB8_ASPCL|nr:uncharacterized protein ACLA_034450 [Aspergillus clavatus NRRL 1]EAW09242.1 hypothetical protein ACLA_034450 [Aspergillus clavatus NRRL 1]